MLFNLIVLALTLYLILGLLRPAWVMPKSWKPSRLGVVGVWFGAIFLLAAVAQNTDEVAVASSSKSKVTVDESRPDSAPVAILPSVEEAESAIEAYLSPTWRLVGITTAEGATTIVTELPRVEDDAYYAIISVVCVALNKLGGVPTETREIFVLNRFGKQGWVFQAPEKCREIAGTPIDEVRSKIAPLTRMPLGLLSGRAPRATSRSRDGEWYQGGTLHKGTALEWRTATIDNRLATSADFAAKALLRTGQQLSSMDQLEPRAIAVETCISEAVKNPTPGTTPVSELAAMCIILAAHN